MSTRNLKGRPRGHRGTEATKIVAIRTTPEAYAQVQRLAHDRGESVSAFVRQAIAQRAKRMGLDVEL